MILIKSTGKQDIALESMRRCFPYPNEAGGSTE